MSGTPVTNATSKFGQMPHLLINSIYGRSRNEGAANLCALADKIDTTKMKHPSFLMVLTGVGDYAYKRPEFCHEEQKTQFVAESLYINSAI